MSTIREIARRAGVSVSTASLAMNGDPRVRPETRERVLQVVRELDYHPMRAARSLSSGRTWTLQLLNPMVAADLSAGFFTRFAIGVHHRAAQHGYSVGLSMVESEKDLEAVARRIVRERWADGLILMNPTEDPCLLNLIIDSGFPCVVLGRQPGFEHLSVDSDNVQAARDATRYLLQRAGAPVLFLSGPARQTFTQERAQGYREALAEVGIQPDDRYLYFADQGTAEAGRQAVEAMLRAGLAFRSILAVSDALAVGAMRALREAGLRVPDDVAVMGMNNDDVAEYTDPPLSSVDLRAEDLGGEAAEMLLETIDGRISAPARRLVPHRLVVRASA